MAAPDAGKTMSMFVPVCSSRICAGAARAGRSGGFTLSNTSKHIMPMH
jgi:hypothetical protein